MKIPLVETPIFFNIRTQPKDFNNTFTTKDLQKMKVNIRILYRPDPNKLPQIFMYLGPDYDSRVLPSIANETLKSVVAQYSASQMFA